MTLAVNLGWTDLALKDGLEAVIGRPVVIENDVRAAAIGLHERRTSAGADRHTTSPTSRSAPASRPASILDGRLHRGARGLAGEIGHAIVEPDGPRCACGQHGCLEALRLRPIDRPPRRDAGLPPKEVYARGRAGDPSATDLVEDVGRRLAWAIHTLVMTYDVERVVVGGGVSHAGEPFERPLRRELARLRAASDRRPSCCRPTSSTSCHPRPRPAHGAPSRWHGAPSRDRRW